LDAAAATERFAGTYYSRLNFVGYQAGGARLFGLPTAQNDPSGFNQASTNEVVTRVVGRELRVPEFAWFSFEPCVEARIARFTKHLALPEVAMDKHRDMDLWECDVRGANYFAGARGIADTRASM
jgi:hypothetical protein